MAFIQDYINNDGKKYKDTILRISQAKLWCEFDSEWKDKYFCEVIFSRYADNTFKKKIDMDIPIQLNNLDTIPDMKSLYKILRNKFCNIKKEILSYMISNNIKK